MTDLKTIHTKYVRNLFSRVALNYNLMNDLMSFGAHRSWKRTFVNYINPRVYHKIIDVAGGTGDVANLLLKKGVRCVTVWDSNLEMLKIGQDQNIKRGTLGILWGCGDATNLPFSDNSFDIYTIAFGLRNIADYRTALREASRILKPRGRFYCLEFSKIKIPVLLEIYQFYLSRVIPKLGKFVAKDIEAYNYLAKSIDLYPNQEEMTIIMRENGLSSIIYNDISSGICSIHEGTKIF